MTQLCQATFKKHCQYLKCDCDRPVTAEIINSTEFPRGKRIDQELTYADFHVTDPNHGGKVTCHKCNSFILERDHEGYYPDGDKTEFPMYSFHKDCYNPYEHYYGIDKPLD